MMTITDNINVPKYTIGDVVKYYDIVRILGYDPDQDEYFIQPRRGGQWVVGQNTVERYGRVELEKWYYPVETLEEVTRPTTCTELAEALTAEERTRVVSDLFYFMFFSQGDYITIRQANLPIWDSLTPAKKLMGVES